MKTPTCKGCGKSDKVKLVSYRNHITNKDDWKGFECERCYEVVAVIYEHDDDGKLLQYKPYRLTQI